MTEAADERAQRRGDGIMDRDGPSALDVESLAPDDILRISRSCMASQDHGGALAWLARMADAKASYGDWLAAAALLRRIPAAASDSASRRAARVWICNSYTTVQLAPLLALAGHRFGMRLEILNGGYGLYRQDILDPDSALYAAKPDVVLLAVHAEEAALPWFSPDPDAAVEAELQRWTALWDVLSSRSHARLVMHNLAVPGEDPFGHLSARLPGTRASMLARLNTRLGEAAQGRVPIVDCERLSALVGKSRWFSPRYWHFSRQACSLEALPLMARHTAAVIAGDLGLSKKCLVVDLDNTLWGGIVGEDGVEGIHIGPETPEGRGYAALQAYLKQLKDRGVLLAVCSKNNPDDARAPFLERPEMLLRLDDFAAFVANWDSKDHNLRHIAETLSLGLDSFVFLDDNPVEREVIRRRLPEVEVLALPAEPADYVGALADALVFESSSFTTEDSRRTDLYRSTAAAASGAERAATVDDFLRSLDMQAVLEPIGDANLPRIAQLLGKTNQFNLTTRRMAAEELRELMAEPGFVHMALRLRDRFTDHGLVGVMGALVEEDRLRIDIWAMSCRVIGRTAEATMLSALLRAARARRCEEILGIYIPTAKNISVERLYERFGFSPRGRKPGGAHEFVLRTDDWKEPESFIRVLDDTIDHPRAEVAHVH